ncbi:putative methylene-fatty-acyl-phospholipid synthase [Phaeomoniella chlamydospora]|uniref:Phosphatidyl-N-methylethanolamine N-methyltransferase n=1 Tax=Phaeomoniella chlamydospora TaxID=158046 RepID=A0A0G2ES83_PHACM|nr:putative methylene-fatty-acyl-phospholipid synthase [Phaeomoniella chlamydospora]
MEKLQNFKASLIGGEKTGTIDFSDRNLWISAAAIAFNPIFWNIVARQEYHTHFLTKIFGSPYRGCYALAVAIFSLGLLRDHFYNHALSTQPLYPAVKQPLIGYALLAIGNTLVLSSMWALGVTGTYLGDYFGILMDHKVEGFPFNVTGAPMYWGSTCSFLGWALTQGRLAGLLLTAEVFVMYLLALQFEDPFTADIYAKKDGQRVTRSMTGSTPKQKQRKKA